MREVPFEAGGALVLVWTWIHGPLGHRRLPFVLDTGAARTIIVPKHLEQLGYRPGDAHGTSTIRSPIGVERGHRYRVQRFESLGGYGFDDFEILAHDLGASLQVDGLLGWDFLQHFNVDIRPKQSLIRVEPA